MSEADWYRTLNLTSLARRCGTSRPRSCRDVLVLSTQKLLAAYGDNVELSPLNSGAIHPAADRFPGSRRIRGATAASRALSQLRRRHVPAMAIGLMTRLRSRLSTHEHLQSAGAAWSAVTDL